MLKNFILKEINRKLEQLKDKITVSFEESNDVGHKIIRKYVENSVSQVKIDFVQVSMEKFERNYKKQMKTQQSFFQTPYSFIDTRSQEHAACILVDVVQQLLFKAFNPKARML